METKFESLGSNFSPYFIRSSSVSLSTQTLQKKKKNPWWFCGNWFLETNPRILHQVFFFFFKDSSLSSHVAFLKWSCSFFHLQFVFAKYIVPYLPKHVKVDGIALCMCKMIFQWKDYEQPVNILWVGINTHTHTHTNANKKNWRKTLSLCKNILNRLQKEKLWTAGFASVLRHCAATENNGECRTTVSGWQREKPQKEGRRDNHQQTTSNKQQTTNNKVPFCISDKYSTWRRPWGTPNIVNQWNFHCRSWK